MLLVLAFLLAQEPPLDQLIRQLGDESPDVRDRASVAIARRGESVVPALHGALAGAEPEIQARLRRLIFQVEWEPIVSPSLLARHPLARSAFEQGDHAGFLEHLSGRAGWEHGGSEELEVYAVKLLGNRDPELRRKALEILVLMTREKETICRRPIAAVLDALGSWEPEGWDDPDGRRLQELAHILHYQAGPRDRKALVDARAAHSRAQDLLPILRAGVGDEASIPALLEALKDAKSPWRYLAVESVRKSRCRAAAADVAKLLESDLWWAAWQTLPAIADPAQAPAAVEAYRKMLPESRGVDQYRALLAVRTPEATALVIEALNDPKQSDWAGILLLEARVPGAFDALLRSAAARPKQPLPWTTSASVQGEEALRLVNLLDSDDPDMRACVAIWLWQLASPEARRKAVARFEKETNPEFRHILWKAVGQWPAESVDAARRIAGNPSDSLAPTAAAHLVSIRGAEALPLVEALLDKDVMFNPEQVQAIAPHAPARLLVRLGRNPVLGGTRDLLQRLEDLGARRELAELIKEPHFEAAAATSLLKIGGDASEYLKLHAENIFLDDLDDAAGRNVPGIRDLLRERMKAGKLSPASYKAFRFWAPVEMMPEFRKTLAKYEADRTVDAGDPEPPMICAFGLPGRNWGYDALTAIGATGDPAALPILLERLRDREPGMQSTAMLALARMKAKEAVPALRQIVQSSRWWIRGRALLALAEIGAPGTEEFIRARLRENPYAGPQALARLGVDARDEVRALLEDGAAPAPILGALDLMAHRDVYRAIDAPLHVMALEEFRETVERMTGRPCRVTPAVLARGGYPTQEGETLRERFEGLERYEGITHVFRDGAIWLCMADEAR